MIARYPGKCRYCGHPITVGVDEYDLTSKTSYHPACHENQPPGPEDYALADRLGFKPHAEAGEMDWPVFLLSRNTADRSVEPVRRDNHPRGEQGALRGMFAGEESA